MPNREDMIVDLLKEVRDDQKEHSKVLIVVQKDVEQNTKDLAKHIEGVQQNRKRIEVLEKPHIVISGVKTFVLGLAAILVAGHMFMLSTSI